MQSVFQLKSEESDQLKELLNIGVSHAGTKLSEMLGHRVTISVPSIEVRGASTVTQFINKPDDITIAVLLRLSGGLDGYVLLFFPHTAAVKLLHSLSGKTVGDLRALNEYDRSIFQEVGNVLTAGLLHGLAQVLGFQLLHSVPDVVIDMGGAMFNSLSASMIAAHDEFVSLDVAICVDSTPDAIACIDGEQAVGRMFLLLGADVAGHILDVTRKMTSPK